MRCIDPILVSYDTKGNRQFRHFSLCNNNAFLQRAHLVFNCRTCFICRKRAAFELASRCVLHASLYEQNCFITLTYDEKQQGYENKLEYAHIQKFKKRLRRYCQYHYGKKVDVFNVHEYGKNGKKHWHLILFNHNFEDRKKNPGSKYYNSEKLLKLWPYGHHSIGDVNEASAMYQAQYMEKDFSNDYVTTTKKSKSNHSGLGKPFFQAHYKQLLALGYVPFSGRKLPMPRYFEKLAHKAYCYYYDETAFVETSSRKALYRRPTVPPERGMADSFRDYVQIKKDKIKELETEWDSVILQYLTTGGDPDFVKSGENAYYDLRKKQISKGF